MRSIPLNRLPVVETKIAEINKKAAKRGLPPLTLITGDIALKEVVVRAEGTTFTIDAEFIDVDIAGVLPVIAGYRWLGSIKMVDGCRQVYGDVPVGYRENDMSYCDHCKTKRSRNQVTLVEHVETNEILVIGSTCHHDFFGEQSAETILAIGSMMETFWDATRDDFLESDWNQGVFRAYSINRFLAAACEVVEKYGYVSREKAAEMLCLTTGEEAWAVLGKRYVPAPWAEAKAQAIIDFFKALNSTTCSNYEFNIKEVIKVEHVGVKARNLFASAVVAYDRAMAQKRTNENSQYQGVQGKRQEFTLVIHHIAHTENQWGTKRIYIMLDKDGNQFIWSTNTAITWAYKVEGEDEQGPYSYSENHVAKAGDTVTLKGTVDEHKEYKGVKNTYLKRCTVQALERANEKIAA